MNDLMIVEHFEALEDLIGDLPNILLLETVRSCFVFSKLLELGLEVSTICVFHKYAKRSTLLIEQTGLVTNHVRYVDGSQETNLVESIVLFFGC